MKKNFQSGFTLVELAIVLMIIGLLTAGVLRGQELYSGSQIASTVKEVKSYEAAIVSFRDVYFNNPGDMSIATTKVPGCTTANFCDNGDGNAVIGTRKVGIGLLDIQTGAAKPGVETTLFWKHLAAAHLISGVEPSANPANPVFGKTHPKSSIGGGWMITYGMHVPNVPEGLWLVLTNTLTGSTAYNPDGKNVLSPRQSRQIDQKMDDGLADVGDVAAPDDGTCDQPDAQGVRQYRNSDEKTCTIVFRVTS
jgi:prepilin-type N-terminal cleavage/methylation domain-containing protein